MTAGHPCCRGAPRWPPEPSLEALGVPSLAVATGARSRGQGLSERPHEAWRSPAGAGGARWVRGQTHPTPQRHLCVCSGVHKSKGARTLSAIGRLRLRGTNGPGVFVERVEGDKCVFRADGRAGEVGSTWGEICLRRSRIETTLSQSRRGRNAERREFAETIAPGRLDLGEAVLHLHGPRSAQQLSP